MADAMGQFEAIAGFSMVKRMQISSRMDGEGFQLPLRWTSMPTFTMKLPQNSNFSDYSQVSMTLKYFFIYS